MNSAKQLFLEQYNQVIFNESLPDGIKKDDVISLDDFFKDEAEDGDLKTIDVKVEEDIDDANVRDINPSSIANPDTRDAEMKKPIASRTNKLLHNSTIKAIIDDNGKEIDLEKLKKIMIQKPKNLISQNSKLKKSGGKKIFYDITLPAYQGLFFNKKQDTFQVVRTCPSAGECTKFCYAAKGGYIQFPASAVSASRVVTFLMNDFNLFKRKLRREIEEALDFAEDQGGSLVLRWHDSGDFFSPKYLEMAYDVAKDTPEVIHYAYTKQLPMVKSKWNEKPSNFIFNFSFGGIHDKQIDPMTDKHSQVIPKELFKDLGVVKNDETGAKEVTPENLTILKKRIAEKLSLPLETIISYREMLEKEETKKPYWNVIVFPGDGDDSATRLDVIGTLLLIH